MSSPFLDREESVDNVEGSDESDGPEEGNVGMTLQEIVKNNTDVIKKAMEKFEASDSLLEEKIKALYTVHMESLLTAFCLQNPQIAVELYMRGVDSGETFFSTKHLFQHLTPLITGEPLCWRNLIKPPEPKDAPQ
jgi:hypothetical protein